MMRAVVYSKVQERIKGERLGEMGETFPVVEIHLLCVLHPVQLQVFLEGEIDDPVGCWVEYQMAMQV
jgi:hypothetical protein